MEIKTNKKLVDTVLDPFTGSGTTNFVAQRMFRHSIGIEIYEEYYNYVKQQIEPKKLVLFEPKHEYESTENSRRNSLR